MTYLQCMPAAELIDLMVNLIIYPDAIIEDTIFQDGCMHILLAELVDNLQIEVTGGMGSRYALMLAR